MYYQGLTDESFTPRKLARYLVPRKNIVVVHDSKTKPNPTIGLKGRCLYAESSSHESMYD